MQYIGAMFRSCSRVLTPSGGRLIAGIRRQNLSKFRYFSNILPTISCNNFKEFQLLRSDDRLKREYLISRQYTKITPHKLNMEFEESKTTPVNPRTDLRVILESSIEAVMPRKMIENVLGLSNDGETLVLDGKAYTLQRNVYVVGFGKAVIGMARCVDDLLRPHIVRGVISVPHGCQQLLSDAGKSDLLLEAGSKIKVYEGAQNNIPDEDAHQAAQEIWDLVKKLREKHILLVLVSGGGSALLPLPRPPITLAESAEVTTLLSTHGAAINDLNIVRKQTELLKGGGLARAAKPCKVLALIISDVIGNKLDIISSGPTVADSSCPQLCWDIFERLGIVDQQIPESVRHVLSRRPANVPSTKTTFVTDHTFASEMNIQEYGHVQNVVVGNNTIATETAYRKAASQGYVPFVIGTELQGQAKFVGALFAKLAKYIILSFGYRPSDMSYPELVKCELDLCTHFPKKLLNQITTVSDEAYNVGKGLCFIAGGETVVNVTGTGQGGRNQEMAVTCGLELDAIMPKNVVDNYQVTFVSCGTDGQDGPTTATGGIVDLQFVQQCQSSGYDVKSYLDNNDTFSLLKAVNGGANLLSTGITGTNVMDIQLLLINPLKV